MGVQFSGSYNHVIHTMHQGHRNERISGGASSLSKNISLLWLADLKNVSAKIPWKCQKTLNINVLVCNLGSQHNKYKLSYYLQSVLKVSEYSNSLVDFSLDVSGF